ncbi:MAG: hypothetical protein OXE97_01590 [Gammaproteobacteria bacterium]|nr:hypothetical protein [Gammaproteobacteria bacterium]MCY4281669.1 hypothetical protein [Gammaproteobacteria bacterium]
MLHSDTVAQYVEERDRLQRQLAHIGDFLPGSLQEMRRKCGKPNCRCATDDSAKHVSWAVARRVKDKVIYRAVPAGALDETRRLIGEYQRFRALTKAVSDLNEKLCAARLAGVRTAPKKKRQGTGP